MSNSALQRECTSVTSWAEQRGNAQAPTSMMTPYVGSDRERIDVPFRKLPTLLFPVLLVPTFWRQGRGSTRKQTVSKWLGEASLLGPLLKHHNACTKLECVHKTCSAHKT